MNHTDRGQAKAAHTPAFDPERSALQVRLEDADRTLIQALAERIHLCAAIGGGARPPGTADARIAAHAAAAGLDAEIVRQIYEVMDRPASDPNAAGAATSGAPSVLARNAKRIDHVAIAVRDLDAAIETLRESCGFELVERRRVEGEVSGMLLATLRAGGVTLAVCQGTSARSNVSRYIEAYGPGVQHLAIEVDDEALVIQDLKARGANLLTEIIHGPGLDQAFTRRESNTGMQFEFVARTTNQEFDDENVRKLFTAMERDDVF